MSTVVDKKIVEMRFDNRQFESGVKTTMETLDNLKQSLDMKGAAKGLENIGTAANKFNMSGVTSAVETVRAKFTAFEVMAITTLSNITNSAINSGKRIASSLTIEPISSGFKEYETQINAVQTILANTANKGTTLNQVNAALDELNMYADKTIYNFTEMTRNIGTFTAAGVDLQTSVSAIKGIANLAAVSGSTSQQASTAMYQLSQALSSGTVKLMDWNSVVNAGMGGQVFQDSLKETARRHGVTIDDMIKKEGSFRETLSNGWLSSKILTETLNKFTGDLSETQLAQLGYTKEQIVEIIKLGKMSNDAATKVKTFTQLMDTLKEAAQSGWAQSWKLMVGDFEEAKLFYTEMSDTIGGVIGASADARNKVLSGGLSSGWDQFLREGIADEGRYTDVIMAVAEKHGKSVKDMIENEGSFEATLKRGWLTADIMAESLEELTSKTRGFSDEQLEGLGYTRKQVDELEALNVAVQNGSISVEDFAKRMTIDSGRENIIEAIRNSFKGIANVIKPVSEAFKEVFPPTTSEQLYTFTEGLRTLTSHFKLSDTTSANLKSTFKGLFAVLNLGKQIFLGFVDAIIPLFGVGVGMVDGILEFTAAMGDWLVKMTGMAKVGEAASDMKSGMVSAISDMDTALSNNKFVGMFQTIFNVVKSLADGIVKVAVGLGKGLMDVLGKINMGDIFDVLAGGSLIIVARSISNFLSNIKAPLSGVTDILDSVCGCFEAFQSQLQAKTLITIATAIGILAASILVISLIDGDKLVASLGAITVLFADLMGAMAVFGKIKGNLRGVVKTCSSMIGVSVAILILAGALKTIGSLDFKQMATGLIGVVSLTGIMVATTKTMGKESKTIINGASQMVIFAVAIKVLASACKDLSTLNWEQLKVGLVGVGVLLGEVALFLNFAKFSGKAITTATGIVILASAIKVLASVCNDFAKMGWDNIKVGLVTIGVLLSEIAIFTKLTGDAKHVISTGVALVAIGASMKLFALAIRDMSTLSWDQLKIGLAGMAGALVAVTVAVNFMPKNMVGIGVGLVAVSTALLVLSNALINMGNMNIEQISNALIVLGGALGILSGALFLMKGSMAGSAALLVAAAALTMLIPTLTILGAMGWQAILMGLGALAGAFAVIGVAGLLLTPVIPAIIALAGAFALIGVSALAVGLGLTAVALGITTLIAAGTIGVTAIGGLLSAIVTSVAGVIPIVAGKIGEGIVVFCKVIANSASVIGGYIKSVVLSIIDVIADVVPKVVEAVVNFVSSILQTIVRYVPEFIQAGIDIIVSLLRGIRDNIGNVVMVVIEIVNKFVGAVSSQIPKVVNSAIDFIVNFIDALGVAIKTETPRIVKSVVNLAGNIIQGLIDGLLAGVGSVVDNIKNLGSSILNGFKEVLGIHSPSREFMYLGQAIGDGLVIGVDNSIGPAVKATGDMAEQIIANSKKSIGEFESWVSDRKYINELSLTEELTAWEAVQARYIAGSDERKKADREVYRLQNELVTATYKYSMDWIDEEKYYKRLSLADELAAYTRIQSRYMKGTDERKKADREVFRLQNEINDAQLQNQNELRDAQLQYQDDVDRVYADSYQRRLDLEQEYADKTLAINARLNQDIQSANDEYDNAVKSRTKSLYSSYGLFDRANAPKEVSGEALTENLQGQLDSFEEWQENLKDLSKRGVSSDLLDELKAMGPSALGEIKALSSMTDDELTKYSGLWGQKHSLAKEQAVSELESLRVETQSKIVALRAQADIELTEYRDVWNKQMDELNVQTSSQLMALESSFKEKVNSLKTNTEQQFTQMSTNVGVKVGDIKTNTEQQFTQMVTGVKTIVEQAGWSDLGKLVVDGFASGISANIYKAEASARAMANAAAIAARESLDINSPSKVGYGIGDFFGLGFVNAITDYRSKVYEASANMADSAKYGLSQAISKVTDFINGNIDTQPVIRPVLDLTGVEASSNRLSSLFSRSQAVSISAGMREASVSDFQNEGVSLTPGNSYQFTQNNYSPKALSRLEIYRQTKNQFSAMKGLV